MRNLSFMYTLDSFMDGTKDVTRRIWKKAWVKPGDRMIAVEKAQGLGKGGKIKRIGEIEIISIRKEPLTHIFAREYTMRPRTEMAREGFPALDEEGFITLFCKLNGCPRSQEVYRIEFKKISTIYRRISHTQEVQNGN